MKSVAATLSFLAFSILPAQCEKPNVIVFLIDDLGWTDLSCQGSKFYETPNLDKLAASGIRLTNSYSANPVCSPTRAALLTGKAPQRVGITQWIPQPSTLHLPAEETTIAEAFQSAGYQTGYIGKWHLGEKNNQLPTANGFSWMKSVNRAGQPASYFFPYTRKSKRGNYWDVPDLKDGMEGDYLTDALTDHALDFIKEKKAKPFFLYFGHYAVHTPIQAPKELVKKYDEKRKKLYGNSRAEKIFHRYQTTSRPRQDHATYAAMMENLDTNIGRVMTTLDELRLTENTIILFTSDNGGHCHLKKSPGVTCNLPLKSGKGWTFEGGIRIPTIISWKGKLKPGICDTPMISMDVMPTLLDLTDQKLLPKQHLDGTSLKPALLGNASPALNERTLAWTYPHNHGSGHRPSHAIRKGNWKLIRFDTTNTNELYDLSTDLGEKTDQAKKHPDKVNALHAELAAWIKETTP